MPGQKEMDEQLMKEMLKREPELNAEADELAMKAKVLAVKALITEPVKEVLDMQAYLIDRFDDELENLEGMVENTITNPEKLAFWKGQQAAFGKARSWVKRYKSFKEEK